MASALFHSRLAMVGIIFFTAVKVYLLFCKFSSSHTQTQKTRVRLRQVTK